ncbi:MAG TPA: hypothetical protein VD867_18120, partial [Burkholderiales bacterium]|nr:hypothetical protein [Burkholderiales bacterium]
MSNASSLALASGLAVLVFSSIGISSAQTIDRVKPGDASLDCPAIAQEGKSLDGVIAAGDANTNAVGRSAAGAAAGVGGQIAGSMLGGLFGPLGSVIGGAGSNAAARTATEQSMAPNAATRQRAGEAASRKDFLTQVAAAKGCNANDPSVAGKALTAEEFEKLAAAAPTGKLAKLTPLTLESLTSVLGEPVTPYPAGDLLSGKLDLKGKRFYLAEFRVLFDVGGKVTANTRAGYMPGRDYGATNVRVNYSVPNVDIAAFQAITDKAFEDFKARLTAAGVKLEDTDTFVRENGAVYEATEQASRPGAPVFFEKNFGHSERKYLVMAPTGTKILSRGFIGIGAGNISKRVDFSHKKLEGLSVSMAVNMAALESSGSGSAILRRSSTAEAKESMSVGGAPDSLVLQGHAVGGGVTMAKALAVDGSFATFREA